MQIENIYPDTTSEQEWRDLAILASQILTAAAVSLRNAEVVMPRV